MAGQTLADTHIAGALLALALGDQHLDDLTPPRDQLTEQPRRLIGDRPRFGLYRFGKPRDHLGIDRIGLGPFAERLREVAHLRRVDNHQRQLRSTNRRRHYRLKPPGRLHCNQHRCHDPQPIDQRLQAFAVSTDCKRRPVWTHVHIQPVLRHIDADECLSHGDPSLRKRARFAAQATVRVRWNDRRGPSLRNGLECPRMIRSPVRHRASYPNQFGDS